MATAIDDDEDDYEENATTNKLCPVPFLNKCLRKTDDASAFAFFRMGNGPLIMSNVFMSAALVTLAKKEVNCYHADDDIDHDDCDTVYGFKPSSLITNIGTIGNLISAFAIPFIGAVIDCTDHRRTVGILAALVTIIIQATQIGTFQSTWFVMAILQTINVFINWVHLLASFSYLPEIAADVGEELMIKYNAEYYVGMFGMEIFYLVLCIGIGIALGLGDNDEATARLGQIVNVIVSGLFYYIAWYFFTSAPARRKLDKGESIVTAGFVQVFKTAKGIKKHYSSTLGYFLLATIFSDASASAFTLVAVTYFAEVCNIGGQQLGLIFIVILLGTIPGSYFGVWVCDRTNPKTCIQIQHVCMIIFNFVAFSTMTKPEPKFLPFIYGAIWGVLLGWFYASEMSIFSIVQPKGQESELTGIFIYCSLILSWLPTLVFTIMNENDIHMSWGGMVLNVYFLIALVFYQFMAPWDQCVDISKKDNLMLPSLEEP